MGALFVLACAVVQAATASGLLASALVLALHAAEHEHSVAIVEEGGHRHLVFSHDGDGDLPGHNVPHRGDTFTSHPDGDHVYDLADGDDATTRRVSLDHVPLVALAIALPSSLPPRLVVRPPPEPRARGRDPLRTVVLLL